MASKLRCNTTELPAHLKVLLKKLSEHGRSFIEQFDCNKNRIQDIIRRLTQISGEVKELQEKSNTYRFFSACAAGAGVTACLAAGVLLGTSAAGEKVAVMATAGCAATVLGGGSLVLTNINKNAEETRSIENVDVLVKEFMKIIKPLKNILEKIRKASTELEEKSSSLMTRTREQARKGLSKTKRLEKLLNQTAELAEKSSTALGVIVSTQSGVTGLLGLLRSLTQVTPTPVNDTELRNCIKDSVSQCEKTLNEFTSMRKMLKDYEEMQEE